MSTILKALKKLEHERPPAHITVDSGRPSAFDSRRTLRRAAGRHWSGHHYTRWLLMAVALAGMVGGAILAGSRAMQSKTSRTSPPLASRQHNQTKPEAVIQDTVPSSTEISKAMHVNAADRTESLPGPDTINPTVLPDAAGRPALEPAAPGYKAVSADQGLKAETRSDKPTTNTSPVRRSTIEAKPETAAFNSDSDPLFSQTPLFKDDSLMVQAIAWSTMVEERMAVINNQIVHQGNTVDGFTVVAIGEDQVLVKKGQERYRVPFGSR